VKNIILLTVILLSAAQPSLAQPEQLKDYRNLLAEKQLTKGFERDTGYIHLLIKFANAFYEVNADSLLFYAQKAYSYARAVNYESGESKCLSSMGNFYSLMEDYPQMLSYYQQALSLAEKMKDGIRQSQILMDLGQFYLDQQKFAEANIDYEKAYELIKAAGDSNSMAYVLTDKAAICFQRNEYDRSLALDHEALQIGVNLKNDYVTSFIRVDIAALLLDQGQFKATIATLGPASRYYRATGDILGQMQTVYLLARSYRGLGRLDKALANALLGFSLANGARNKYGISAGCQILTRLYERMGDYRKSLYFFKLYKLNSDSLSNDDTRKKIIEQETKYVYEKKEALVREEHARESLLYAQHIRDLQQRTLIYALCALLSAIIGIWLYWSRALKQRNNHRLEAKNKEIAMRKEEVEQQAAQLKESNRQKDKLFSIIAHDLRGPLNSLKQLLDFLKEKSLSEVEIAKTVNSLKTNVHSAADLVNNLLYWARNQLEGIEVVASAFEIEPLAGNILNLFNGQAADKKITLQNGFDRKVTVCADRDMIHLVFRNLVSNAIKFCRPGDNISIEGGDITDGLTSIFVVDTGIGIKEEVLSKINGNESVTTYGTSSEKGTGLGLLLCKEFVEKNGGKFRVLSEWGRGSRICVYLPIVSR
jgi:two-component system sensor histidine kinase/response regulator